MQRRRRLAREEGQGVSAGSPVAVLVRCSTDQVWGVRGLPMGWNMTPHPALCLNPPPRSSKHDPAPSPAITFLLLQDMTCYKYTVWCIPSNRYNSNPALTWNELYDLGLDPYETINRCGKCECAGGNLTWVGVMCGVERMDCAIDAAYASKRGSWVVWVCKVNRPDAK